MENKIPKQRILQVCRLTPLWGMDLFCEVSKALTREETEVTTVFLCGKKKPELYHQYQGKLFFLELNRRSIFWRLQAFFKLGYLSYKHAFDIIICQDYKSTLLMYFVSLFIKLPKCYSVQHIFGNFRRRTARWFLKRLRKNWHFLTVSTAVKKEIQCFHIPEKNITTLYNAIDIEKLRDRQFTREIARSKLGLSQEVFIFGTLGRLVSEKGHQILIEAFQQSAMFKNNIIKLLIIGTGHLEEKLKNYIRYHNLEESIFLITSCAHEGAYYLKALDVFVFPSLQEGFGIALLEALCAQLPIIATTAGGIPEAASPYSLLIPPGDTLSLTRAMETYASLSAAEREHLGKQGFHFLEQHFSLAHYHQRIRAALYLNENIQ